MSPKTSKKLQRLLAKKAELQAELEHFQQAEKEAPVGNWLCWTIFDIRKDLELYNSLIHDEMIKKF